MPPKQNPHNTRMLQVIEEYQPISGLNKTEFWDKIGVLRNNASKYATGQIGFTPAQIQALCKLTGVSADWIFGLSKDKYRKEKASDPITMIEQALSILKAPK